MFRKANASKNKFTSQQVKVSPPQYLEELESAVEKNREVQGKNAIKEEKKL